MNLIEALKVNGKAKHPSWNGWYIEYDESKDRFMMSGDPYMLAPSYALSQDWEPYVAPCKHEPIEEKLAGKMVPFIKGFVMDYSTTTGLYKLQCRHCHAKIKSTGWVIDDLT